MEDCQALPSSWTSSLQNHCTGDEPRPHNNNKDAFFVQQRDETNLILSGFRKISLPVQSLGNNNDNNTCIPSRRPSYQRSFSDPSAGLKPSKKKAQRQLPVTEALASFSSSLMNSCVSPPQSKMGSSGVICSCSAGLPPQHPTLSRSFSTPMQPKVKSVSPSSSCVGMMVESSREVTPELKKIRRMNDCTEEIKHLCNELGHEVQDEATSQDFDIEPAKGWSAIPSVEESVSVEKMKECLAIHFNCPCSRGYQILLSGRNCYYKLM